jgi:hypothetical protein
MSVGPLIAQNKYLVIDKFKVTLSYRENKEHKNIKQ